MKEVCDRSVNTLEVMMTCPCGFVTIGNITKKLHCVTCPKLSANDQQQLATQFGLNCALRFFYYNNDLVVSNSAVNFYAKTCSNEKVK